MIMVIGPHKKKAEAKAEQKATRPPRVRSNDDDEMRDDSEEFDLEDQEAAETAAPVAAKATPPTPPKAPTPTRPTVRSRPTTSPSS